MASMAPLASLSDFRAAIERFSEKFRRIDLPPLVISGVYDLHPHSTPSRAPSEFAWPSAWPNAGQAGVYAFFDDNAELIYVGKSSMNSSLGARLGAYFRFGDGGRCELAGGDWRRLPRLVVTVGVPDSMTWEAPALEEFLIQELGPPLNVQGRR